MKTARLSDSRPPLHAAAVGALFVLGAATLPGSALAAASFEAYGFASLDVTLDAAGSIVALGGSVDDAPTVEPIGNATTDTDTVGSAETQILADTVMAFDTFTMQNVGVAGEALPSAAADSSAFASATSSTSLTFENFGTVAAMLDYTFDYSASVIADIGDSAFDAAGATASILFGIFDFLTGEETPLFQEVLELVTAGDLSVLDAFEGSVEVAPGGFLGFFVDVDVEGLAITTEEESGPALPVPATLLLVGSGLLGLALQRRRRAAVAGAEQAF